MTKLLLIWMNPKSAAGFTYDMMKTFGIHYRKLTISEMADFAFGLGTDSRALEGLSPDNGVSSQELTLMKLTNVVIAYIFAKTGQSYDAPYVVLPSEAEAEMERQKKREKDQVFQQELLEYLRSEQDRMSDNQPYQFTQKRLIETPTQFNETTVEIGENDG